MYDIRQFKPALYLLVLLGFSGFALAARSPGLWMLVVAATLLNAWLVYTDRFRPLPHLLAGVVTILAMLYVVTLIISATATPIIYVGQFLVFLQLVKLYEQRSSRDHAQLLVLSLLLMVAAAINTSSLIFGVILVVYLFLSLYCCLLFHLKVESEQALKAISLPRHRPNPTAVRQDQQFFSRSMRRLTGLIAISAITTAIVVFVMFPRWPASALLGNMQFRSSQTLTGFSESVSFEQVARITQNTALVAHVKLWKNDHVVQGTQPLLLRGLTLDVYTGDGSQGGSTWVWGRSSAQVAPVEVDADQVHTVNRLTGEDLWRQEVYLQPTGTRVLFAVAGIHQIRLSRPVALRYRAGDETVHIHDPVLVPIAYEVVSSNRLTNVPQPPAPDSPSDLRPLVSPEDFSPRERRMPSQSVIDERIREYALRAEVSGTDDLGRLAERRPANAETHELDERIAARIERHLRSEFEYTLDLTGTRRLPGEDPLVGFLYDFRRGHCEYFAGAMTLMCQSLGLKARMVVGFRSDDFNPVGNYYIVRQDHAHAWVEVFTGDGWRTFDPTSARQAVPATGFFATLKHLFDYLEYAWANNVIAFDRGSRANLLQAVDSHLTTAARAFAEAINHARLWLFSSERWFTSWRLLSWLLTLMILALIGAIGWFFWERWRLRKRAARIGLDLLPTPDQVRLVRQLGFYDDMLRLLHRHGISRPRQLTPMEFSDSLVYLPNEAYAIVRRLTRVFYRVRYGGLRLQSSSRRRLHRVLSRLDDAIAPAT